MSDSSFGLGGLAFVATSILIPVLIHFSIYRSVMSIREKVIHVVLALIAFLLMIIATYFSTVSLVQNMLH